MLGTSVPRGSRGINLQNSVELTLEMIAVANEAVNQGTLSIEDAREHVRIAILGEKDAEGLRPINQSTSKLR